MNFTPTYGWYYIDANNKAPAWTGVVYFYNFITRDEISPGPFGVETTLDHLEPGDFIQFRFNKEAFGHTPIIAVSYTHLDVYKRQSLARYVMVDALNPAVTAST